MSELAKRLTEIIEDAPHADYCGAPSSSGSQVFECRCWKAKAMAELERQSYAKPNINREVLHTFNEWWAQSGFAERMPEAELVAAEAWRQAAAEQEYKRGLARAAEICREYKWRTSPLPPEESIAQTIEREASK